MPRPPVGIHPDQRLGQRRVGPLPGLGTRALVDRGSHQRVPQFEVRAGDPQQPGVLGFLERRGGVHAVDRERCAGDGDKGGVVGCRDQHQRLTGRAQTPAAVQEDTLHLGGERQLCRQRVAAGELSGRQGAGQFDQCQRVAVGLFEQPSRDGTGHFGADVLAQQRLRRV